MPNLFRPDCKAKVPDGADIVMKDGRKHVRVPDRRGRPALFPLTSDGKHYTRPAAKWCADVRQADGRRRRVRLHVNKDAAHAMLAVVLKQIEHEKAGASNPSAPRHANAKLADLLHAYQARTDAAGRAARTAELTVSRCSKVFAGCGFALARSLDADAAAGWLASRRGDRAAGGIGPQTFNHYVAPLKAFGNWLFLSGRAAANPFARLQKQNAAVEVRHDRRAFTPDELAALIAAARSGRPIRGMAGPDRAALYLTAAMTGLRASELASLTPESFSLAADQPLVTVRAAYAKNRRSDSLPLHPSLVPVLAEWLAGKPRGSLVWPGKWAEKRTAGKTLARDLAAARATWVAAAPTAADRAAREASDYLAYRDAAGRFADFHALRHTFISGLMSAGVALKLAQELARHGSITLTMDRYAHTSVGDRHAAVRSLPAPAGSESSCTPVAQTPCNSGHTVSTPGTEVDGQTVLNAIPETVQNPAIPSGEGGIRTHGRCDTSPVFKTGALNRSATSPGVPHILASASGNRNWDTLAGRRVRLVLGRGPNTIRGTTPDRFGPSGDSCPRSPTTTPPQSAPAFTTTLPSVSAARRSLGCGASRKGCRPRCSLSSRISTRSGASRTALASP